MCTSSLEEKKGGCQDCLWQLEGKFSLLFLALALRGIKHRRSGISSSALTNLDMSSSGPLIALKSPRRLCPFSKIKTKRKRTVCPALCSALVENARKDASKGSMYVEHPLDVF